MNILKKETRGNQYLTSNIALLAVLFLLVSTVASAANFTAPTANPPAGNVDTLLNVSATDQTKAGNFFADSVGSNDGFCLGEDCVSAWPAGATPSLCHLQSRTVTNQNPDSTYQVGAGCTLSAADAAAGWIVSRWDHCTGVVSRKCAAPQYCVFTRLVCDGAITVAPGTITRN